MRILLVEPNQQTAQNIALMLRSKGCIVDITNQGEDGLSLAEHYDYDLVILELLLPDSNGYETLRQLHLARMNILILSRLSGLEHKVKGLKLGADDYLTKPFDLCELWARLLTIVRRSNGHPSNIIHTGRLAINLDTQEAEFDGQPLRLTEKPYRVLELLSLRRGSVVSRGEIASYLYGREYEFKLTVARMHTTILRIGLRRATGGVDYVGTVQSRGLMLLDPEKARAAAE